MRFKKKKVYKKDNDKEIDSIYNDKFQIWSVRIFFFFGDKDKLHNLRDRKVWTNLWGLFFFNLFIIMSLKTVFVP